ncbi:ankyrin repeat domain-containing protein [Calidithermus chliarophilus]|uniref:ankyrin repeat domain-containing protein n=1 Tax=Calidithermus chliarophilus TaxID=52023 RepID=UPI0003F92DF9|nr:ankyrin repeat domain-containing protein [Calidithermus chliarophilus]
MRRWFLIALMALAGLALAQVPPSPAELEGYTGLLAAAAKGDVARIESLLEGGASPEVRDRAGRTPLLVAAHLGQHAAARALLRGGADPNALDNQRYDLITIAAVRNDAQMIRVGLAGGASPKNVTSPYDGTALIAAAHLGHVEAVRVLLEAKAPLDHVNNLGWTALHEAIILGDGGPRHTEVVRLLLEAGANPNLADRGGVTPLQHARQRGYTGMVRLLEQAGMENKRNP